MENNAWNKFKLRIDVNADVDQVYRALATPEGLESWFLREALFNDAGGELREKDMFLQEGDTYQWRWHGHPDNVTEKGSVLKANGKNVFSFTFSLKCPVTVSIHKNFDRVIVELVESDLPTDSETAMNYFVGDSRGWVFYLANLKSVLEGGLDLRNKNLKITNVINS